jgi:hypothetical protein
MSVFRRRISVHERPAAQGGKWASSSAEAFLERGTELVDVQGVRDVTFSFVEGHLAELTASAAFRSLERINLLRAVNDSDASLIGRTPFSRIHTLVVEDSDLTADGVRALLGGNLANQLVRLDLSGNRFGDDGFAALGSVPLPKLEALRLYGCAAWESGAASFARSARVPSLRELDLGGEYFTVTNAGGNVIGPAGAEALAAASFVGQLEVLLLRGNHMQNAGAIALARVAMPVRHVDLSWNTIGPLGAAAVARAPWPQLRRLGICRGNPLEYGRELDEVDPEHLPRTLTGDEIEARYGFPDHVRDVY